MLIVVISAIITNKAMLKTLLMKRIFLWCVGILALYTLLLFFLFYPWDTEDKTTNIHHETETSTHVRLLNESTSNIDNVTNSSTTKPISEDCKIYLTAKCNQRILGEGLGSRFNLIKPSLLMSIFLNVQFIIPICLYDTNYKYNHGNYEYVMNQQMMMNYTNRTDLHEIHCSEQKITNDVETHYPRSNCFKQYSKIVSAAKEGKLDKNYLFVYYNNVFILDGNNIVKKNIRLFKLEDIPKSKYMKESANKTYGIHYRSGNVGINDARTIPLAYIYSICNTINVDYYMITENIPKERSSAIRKHCPRIIIISEQNIVKLYNIMKYFDYFLFSYSSFGAILYQNFPNTCLTYGEQEYYRRTNCTSVLK